MTKDQSLSIILLIQKSQDQILQVLRGAGAGNQKQLKFSVIQYDTLWIELHQPSDGGGVAHGAE